MIKPKELRIGNLLDFHGKIETVEVIALTGSELTIKEGK